jgi:hypothetical protein
MEIRAFSLFNVCSSRTTVLLLDALQWLMLSTELLIYLEQKKKKKKKEGKAIHVTGRGGP